MIFNTAFKMRNLLFCPSFSSDVKILTGAKKADHLDYKRTKSTVDYNRFSLLRIQCKLFSDHFHAKYIQVTENSTIGNPMTFWNYINVTRSDNKLPKEKSCGIDTAEMSEGIAEPFAAFLSQFIRLQLSTNYNFTFLSASTFPMLTSAEKRLS